MSFEVAIDRYIASVQGAGYSPNTVRAYTTRLNDVFHWLVERAGEGAPTPDALQSPAAIQDYLASLRTRRIGRRYGVSDQTLSHAYAVLSGFYRYLERTLRLEPNPMRDVIKPRGETSVDDEFHALTREQLDELLTTALDGWSRSVGAPDLRTTNRRIEDWLILALMGLAGLRVSEVCNLDRDDVRGDMIHVLGKGRKRRAVPLAPDILEQLDAFHAPSGCKHLFGSPRDPKRRITQNAVQQRVPLLARRAGILELRVTPHVLRHTFGSMMLTSDPTALVPTRDLMGHESVETTNKYAHTREEARRMALTSMLEARKGG